MTNYQTWEDRLNNLGLFAEIETLTNHLAEAPDTNDQQEIDTITLLKKVIETRQRGGEITKITYH
jgi:hypothetical protein